MKKWFQKLFLVSLMATFVVFAACGKEEKKEEVTNLARLENKEEVRVAISGYGNSLDPCAGWGSYGNPLIQSRLLQINAENKLENDLATGYTVSKDGLLWTFTIREDVKFHDGEKLTAKDVAFTFNNTKALASSVDLTNLKEAVALDDKTVEFRMNAPFSSFLYTTASLGIVPEHAYKDSESYSKNPIGSGPLKFVQNDEGQQLILERNEDYYGKKTAFKRLVMLNMGTDAAYTAVKAGEVDVAKSNEALVQNKVEGYHILDAKTYDYRVISMPVVKEGKTESGDPMGNPVTSDIAIRKALSLGISRANMIQNVLYGFGEPTFDVFSQFPWGIKQEVANLKDGDLEAAKKILEEAGWLEKDNGIREKDGVRAEFVLMYGASDLGRQAIAIAFAEEAKKLGIDVKATGLDWSEIEKRAKVDPMVLGGGVYNPMRIGNLFDSKYAPKSGWSNVAVYSNPITDDYIKKATESVTEEEANQYWKKALWDGKNGGSILGDIAYIPVCYVSHLFFVRDGIDIGQEFVQPHDHGLAITMNITEWDYKK